MSPMNEQLPFISPDVLEEVLGICPVYILGRTTLDEKTDKRMEHLRLSLGDSNENFSVFVKYGHPDSIVHEMMVYDAFLAHNIVRVPKLLGHRASFNGLHVLALEFLEGTKPDFRNENVVDSVFQALGESSARLRLQAINYIYHTIPYRSESHILQSRFEALLYNILTKETMIDRLTEISRLAEQMQQTVLELGGTELCHILLELGGEFGSRLTDSLSRMPVTLDSRDISMHNVIYQADDKFWFLDFEYSKLCPMVFVVDVLGETWGSLPRDALAERAVRSFLEGWNRNADIPVNWDDFVVSYKCARVYWKAYEFQHGIPDLLKDEKNEEQRQWLIDKATQLIELVDVAKQAMSQMCKEASSRLHRNPE